ncbi:MAG: hypothetical protein J6T46_12680, partial [Victivallales bacterium]|nr:hypothetical protein [Victivallales bacterium]
KTLGRAMIVLADGTVTVLIVHAAVLTVETTVLIVHRVVLTVTETATVSIVRHAVASAMTTAKEANSRRMVSMRLEWR